MSRFGSARSQLLYWTALALGVSYFVATRTGFEGADMVAWKGSGVAFLAIWATRHADTRDGWMIAAVLALGAAGDVLLATHGLAVGGVAFLAGHLIATYLYLNGEGSRGGVIAAVSGVMVGSIGYALTANYGVALYAAALGSMAGAATLGRFPRIVAIGAWLFVVSDLLIFARIGPLAGSTVPDWTVWPTYFLGQALIAWGVVSAQAGQEVP